MIHPPLVSVIIPCKGRLEHLRDCIPQVCEQTHNHLEIIVVDFRCPDGCGQWVAEEVKDIRVRPVIAIGVADDEWNLSAARNIGIRASAGALLWFLDADARPDPSWLTDYLCTVDDKSYVAAPSASILVSRGAALSIGGFNELLVNGWGWEDIDFFNRLHASGLKMFRADSVNPVHHGDELRNTYHGGTATNRSLFKNQQMREFSGL